MNDLIQYAQLLMDFLGTSGATLNLESQRALGSMLQQILELIQQEESETITTVGPVGPEINEAMPSSNVEGFAYDDKTGRLLVRFLGKHPNRFGPIYSYEGVPENIFEIFRKGAIPAKTDGQNKWGKWWKGKYPSIGAAMYHIIRAGAYPYRRVA